MTTNDKLNLTAAIIVALAAFGVFSGWNAVADWSRARAAAKAAHEATWNTYYDQCMSKKLVSGTFQQLDPALAKKMSRGCVRLTNKAIPR